MSKFRSTKYKIHFNLSAFPQSLEKKLHFVFENVCDLKEKESDLDLKNNKNAYQQISDETEDLYPCVGRNDFD